MYIQLLFTHKVSRYFVVGVRELRICCAHWIPTIAGKNDLIIILVSVYIDIIDSYGSIVSVVSA